MSDSIKSLGDLLSDDESLSIVLRRGRPELSRVRYFSKKISSVGRYSSNIEIILPEKLGSAMIPS